MESRVCRFRNNQPAVFGGLVLVDTLRLRLSQAHGCPPLLNSEIKHVLRIFALASLTLLTACFEEADGAVSYLAVNHTDRSIVSITVNGEGGILGAPAQGGGGEMCCVTLPSKWRPGLKVTIGWENDGDWLLDARGEEVIRDGKRVYVPLPWKTRTVDVPEYKGEDAGGRLHIHFLPNDEVKVLRSVMGYRSSAYPIPHPKKKAPLPEQP